ncbi:MAG TPA: antibiotic biosynthesis monooxygenase [Terriglobales bacterium]|nr:antibiotic biosynthesis monooxygenase [Terriglobales bacterium]
MFARLFQADVKTDKLQEYTNRVRQEVDTTIRKQAGLLELISMTSESNPGRVAVITFWRTPADAENYSRNVAPRVHESIKPFLKTTPTIEHFNVDVTTGSKIAAAA